MPHQQKLRHVIDLTNIPAAGTGAVAHGLQIDGDSHPALAVAPSMFNWFWYGADPIGAQTRNRVWFTAIGTLQYTLNWAGVNAFTGVNLRVEAMVPHSICMDYSSTQIPY
jgi:hypothetical protein